MSEVIGQGRVTLHWQPDAPTFTQEQLAQVEEIWAKRPMGMFNGGLFNHHETVFQNGNIRLIGSYTEYKFYFAQRHGVDLGLHPMGVSGLIEVEGHVVFARRSPHVTAYKNYFELVPSGGLDETTRRENGTVDVAAQIRDEFVEEVGLPAEVVREVQPFAVIYTPSERVYDVACVLTVSATPQTILNSLRQSIEYTAPVLVPRPMLKEWMQLHQQEILPTCRAILSAWELQSPAT
ncbi:MAG: hypothetical protein K8I82_13390 [Anaerolineae bacterium]|nr:hypothetical protein [Anaerolineae bacterium]